jgi:ent-kaurene oxidase
MGLDFDYSNSGLPFLGNLLQLLKERKPHQSFTTWAMKYMPIFSIQVGSIKQVVITSPKIAKEVQTNFQD